MLVALALAMAVGQGADANVVRELDGFEQRLAACHASSSDEVWNRVRTDT
ncbi:MAG: hypothetical protein ACM3NQ_01385 [Bacteroidales bacterium]